MQPSFTNAAVTEDLQIQAESVNFRARNQYLDDITKMQISVDAGRPIPAIPIKPSFMTVSDPVMDRAGFVTVGEQTLTPWPEILPDLQERKVWKSGETTPTIIPIIIQAA